MSWIKCSERMPKEHVPVLVYGYSWATGRHMTATYELVDFGIGPKFSCVGATGAERENELSHEHITHWQPLPEPPNE
jgi:hypothetical protein